MTTSKIISNSSPIIALSIIKQIHLLNKLFKKVFVPEGVYREIVHGASSQKHYGKLELEQAVGAEKISVYHVKDRSLLNKLYGKVHQGELEVLVGAKELNLDFVLIDERAARQLAETFLLTPIGTVGLLVLAKKRGEIKEIKGFLDTLLDHGFRININLYRQILADLREI